MTDAEQREAARQFVNKWQKGGDEIRDCHPFWIELLQNVLGVENATDYISFEKPVKLPEGDGKIHSRRIDGYIPSVKVLIEQKGSSHPLDEKEPQSGGELLTPYEQAKRYNDNLPFDEKARWIVTSNFISIWVYDMNATIPEPVKIELIELQNKYPLLDFLVKKEVKNISHEMEVSIKAGDIVGLLYDAFLKQYGIPETVSPNETPEEKAKREHKLRSLNALCVRLVFLFYAEDAGIFARNQFHDYLAQFPVREMRRALIDLFKVLDTKINERDDYLEDDLKAFPYVNGGLFSDESIEIPQFNDEIKDLILVHASEDFNWRDISPTIFGAVFESTLNPETRRSGGMHYTSVENIHKVIDPLFLDDLKAEFQTIKAISVPRTKKAKLHAFQKKLASLTFLDPACGSGNFLTESYLSLRKLENSVIAELSHGQQAMVGDDAFNNPIQVSIQQFYGIEINDFAVTVAKIALWIAESQMLEETKDILYGFDQDFLPLKTYVNITEGNALRIDWNDVIPASKLTYIMGNPPFVGASMCSSEQKKEIVDIVGKIKLSNSLDYVVGWYYKAAEMIQGTNIHCAFVSTNSITQGEQVAPMWDSLLHKYGIKLDFAYRTFIWDSEANDKAHVYCVIIGFSVSQRDIGKKIFENDNVFVADHINPYLLDAPDVLISSRSVPFSNVPKLTKGNQPTDDGNFIMTEKEKNELLSTDPSVSCCVRRYIGSRDFLHNDAETRYCLWLKDINPSIYSKNREIMRRLEAVREFRSQSSALPTRKAAEWPYRFFSCPQKETNYLLIPRHSSWRRRYIPIGFMKPEIIASDANSIINDATIYDFGILTSNVHMAWMRVVAGRLKGDYRYSGAVVYNTFPWPSPSADQKQKIEQTAQGILDARALYPDSSLADLYDPLTMPPELQKAHIANDRAVMKAYGFSTKMTEAECVAELMKMYEALIAKEESTKKS